jgi:hypothetical protein
LVHLSSSEVPKFVAVPREAALSVTLMWAARQNHHLHDAKHNPQPMPSVRKRIPG